MQVQRKFTLFLPWCSHPRILCSHILVQWNNTKQWKKRETTKVTSLICIIALKIIPYFQFHVKWVQNMMSHQTKPISFSFFFGWKGKVALIRKPETWGEGRLMSQTNSEDSAWPWQFFKGKRRKNFSELWGQEVGFCIIFHCVQTAWLLIFLQMLSCPADLPAGLLRGCWRWRASHSLTP